MIQYFKKLTVQTLIYGMGDVIVRAIAFLLIPLYTRHLTPEAYGVYSLVQTFQMILTLVLGVGLNSAIFKAYNEADEEREKNRVVSTALIFLGIWGLPMTVLLYGVSTPLSSLVFGSTDQALYLKLLFIAVFFDLFRLMALAMLRAREQPTLYSVVNVIHFSLLVGLNVLNVAIRKQGILGILESQLITSFLLSIGLGTIVFRKIGLGFSRRWLRSLLDFGLPMVPSGVAAWSMTMMAQYFIHFYWNDHEVGLYSLGWRFGMILNMLLVHPFRTAWLPFMFSVQKEARAKKVYSLTLTYFLLVGTFFFLALSVLAREIVLVFATQEYLEGYRAIPFIALAYLFYGMYYTVDVGVLLTGKTKFYAAIMAVAALFQIGLNFLIVPRYGMTGAAFVTMSSYLVLFILMCFVARRLYPIRYETGRIAKIVLVGAAVYAIGSLIRVDAIWTSAVLKLLLIASFPVLLWMFRFFHPQEITAVRLWIQKRQTTRRDNL